MFSFYDFRPSIRSRQRSNGAKPSSLERTSVTPRTEDRGPIRSACNVSRTTGTVGIDCYLPPRKPNEAAHARIHAGLSRQARAKAGLAAYSYQVSRAAQVLGSSRTKSHPPPSHRTHFSLAALVHTVELQPVPLHVGHLAQS